jgi:hypothetical protein
MTMLSQTNTLMPHLVKCLTVSETDTSLWTQTCSPSCHNPHAAEASFVTFFKISCLICLTIFNFSWFLMCQTSIKPYNTYWHFSANKTTRHIAQKSVSSTPTGWHQSHVSKTLPSYCQHISFLLTVSAAHTWFKAHYPVKTGHYNFALGEFFSETHVKTNVNPKWTILSWRSKHISAHVWCDHHITLAISYHYPDGHHNGYCLWWRAGVHRSCV